MLSRCCVNSGFTSGARFSKRVAAVCDQFFGRSTSLISSTVSRKRGSKFALRKFRDMCDQKFVGASPVASSFLFKSLNMAFDNYRDKGCGNNAFLETKVHWNFVN